VYCTKCGSINLDGDKFCAACGQALGIAIEGASATVDIVYAGFWQRFAALFIDGIILCIAIFGLSFVLGVSIAVGGASFANILWIYALSFAMSAAYFTLMESSESGATYGKRWLNLRVTDEQGKRLTRGRAFARWLAHALSNFTFYIGYLIQPFTEKKQALHDIVSSTVVISTDGKNKSTGLIIGLIVGFIFFISIMGILAAIAIPAYSGYVAKAKVAQAHSRGESATHALDQYFRTHGKFPDTLSEAGVQDAQGPASASEFLYDTQSGQLFLEFNDKQGAGIAGKHLAYTPTLMIDNTLEWKCSSPDIRADLLITQCK
jgi:uncharacterized RDD family membrane protein YckC/type II secretory pathway pseudopilin PulG